jgi:hypothetical protein
MSRANPPYTKRKFHELEVPFGIENTSLNIQTHRIYRKVIKSIAADRNEAIYVVVNRLFQKYLINETTSDEDKNDLKKVPKL